ncbi:MAG: hypothetical protein ABIP85_28020 [Chthoniobacteraceae bacterium]
MKFLSLFIILGIGAAAHAAEPIYEALVQQRLNEGVGVISKNPYMTSTKPSGQDVWKALLLLHENKNIEEAERYVIKFCENPLTEYVGKPVPQVRNEALFRIYLTEKTRARLSAKTKTAIEDFAWLLLTKYNRDITRADADKPFWSFSSSENHYVNDRRRYTQALQIVRMSDRFGPSHKLGDETIESHYQAWNAFWIRYFEARAGQGTDMEIAHPSSYGLCTVGVYYDLFDFTDSPRLRELAGKFLTLYWAEIAAEFEPRTGIRALAATRNPAYDGVRTFWARDLLHAYRWHDNPMTDASPGFLPFFFSSYRPPEILRAIASDPKRGPYQTTSRRALLIDEKGDPGVIVLDQNGDGHFRRDVFYTPDYTLATMTLDPARLYEGVGDLAQTMGVNFSSGIADRIIAMGTGYYAKRAINGITGNAVSIIARDPRAKEGRGRFMSEGTRVFIRKGTLWDNRVEDPSGWFFTRAGAAYAAIRISSGGYTATTRTYTWPGRKLEEVAEQHGHHLELKDMWAPIVIQMGRAGDYASFEAFQASVKDNKFDYQDGKLTYVSEAKETFEVWSKGTQLPKINGTTVNLNPKKTYNSPFLSMEHGSNKAVISYPGYKDVVLDFNPESKAGQ